MGQKIKLQLFLHLLEHQQIQFRFISSLLQLALQLGDLRLPFRHNAGLQCCVG